MPSCHSVHDLELDVQDLWAYLPPDNIRCLINSMPVRVAACFAAGAKRLGLINRCCVTIHPDNARLDAAVITCQMLMGLDWEVLFQPPYSSDLAPINYHLFRVMNKFFSQKIFDDLVAGKTAI
ncbi:hypothetical protein TNCV_244941 [Trichonephila clavipes]|uniref:Transposase n=1 Tax=Trichonephila clavipes TaxID=2585209 RepID=A0A8X6V6G6_TRICX|nr:hypothetical protein TNCV_244941 [Trichonephila clavipes]